MHSLLADVCCASLPPAALAYLAPLRLRPGVSVKHEQDRTWIFWSAGDEPVLHRVLAIGGARLFARRDPHWYRPGSSLPSFDVPDRADAVPLRSLLTPAPVTPEGAMEEPVQAVVLTVVRDTQVRKASALACSLAELARWADLATSRQLAQLQGARRGQQVLLRGQRLPPLAGGQRYWGSTVLVPLGHRPEPDLAEATLAAVIGLQEGDAALLDHAGVEVVAAEAFRPLSRAAVRLAVQEPLP